MKVRSPSCWTAGKVGLPISMRASCDAAICPKFTRVYLLRRKISAERDSQVCMVTIRMLLNTWFNTHLVRMDHQLPSSIFRPLTPGPHVLLLAVMSLSVPSPGAAPQHVLGLRGLFAVPSVSSDLIRVRVGRVQPMGDCPSCTLQPGPGSTCWELWSPVYPHLPFPRPEIQTNVQAVTYGTG